MASNPPVESLPPLPELTTLGSSLSPDMITELIALRAEVALLRAENEKLRAHQASQTILPISIPVPDTANAPVASDTKGEITLTPPKQDTHSGEVQTLRNQVHTLQKAHELLAERVKLLETCDFAKKETNVVASPVSLSISPEEAPTCPFVPQTERKNSAGGFSFTDMLAEGGTVSAFSPAAKEGEEDDTIGDGSLSHKSVVNETFGSYCPDEKQRRKSALSSKLSSSSTTSSTLKAVISYDWNTLVAMKTGPWADITVDVSKQQLETVIASWNAIKNGGLVAKLGTSAMECLFSQNPEQLPFRQRAPSQPRSLKSMTDCLKPDVLPIPNAIDDPKSISSDLMAELILLRSQVVVLRAENEALRAQIKEPLHAKVIPTSTGTLNEASDIADLQKKIASLLLSHGLLVSRVEKLEREADNPDLDTESANNKPTCPFAPKDTALPLTSRRGSDVGSISTINSVLEEEDDGEEQPSMPRPHSRRSSVTTDLTSMVSYVKRRASAASSSSARSSLRGTAYDWNTLVAAKQVPWTDITIDVTKEQMDTVIESWKAIKKAGQVDKLGKSAMECLFSQNPGYKRLYPDPSAFPLANIVERIVSHSQRNFGKKTRAVVADVLVLGWKHMHEMGGLKLKDFKCMTLAVTYGITEVRDIPHDAKKKEILAWQVLMRELSVIMSRGGAMTKDEIEQVIKGAKVGAGAGASDEKQCKVM
ncbi:hypothetical protein M427DRAFT_65985 [Gonapodya prolifera JEL478]|uniref:Uncharacterized protein n=1 Tax=Gonapodya prolifera (strain JEL478) TaxID=1344416 RepID=A0A139AWU6_GONPJ|nr:hypothetical protein M427DRAFT_65985 [Gonapodya prolifera JEL478]|eukprot:KXS21221.1 hypothetical protein M427DRAFT_65985 [Gonapodya prolifera JEL478]